MSNPLLVDADNFIKTHILMAATGDLQANGTWTGGVWGTLNTLTAMLATQGLDVGEIFFFFDAGVPAHRKLALPGYKEKRAEKKKLLGDEDYEKAMGQMHLTRQMLELLGVVCAAYKDREADDCCAAASQLFCDQGRQPIIVSNDKDLLQCVKWGARVYRPSMKLVVDKGNFEEVCKVPVQQWLLFRTLTGDTTDEIKGAIGVGDGRALDLIRWTLDEGLGDCCPEDQLLDVSSVIVSRWPDDEKRPAWANGVIADLERLQREMVGIDMRSSFGPTNVLAKKLTTRPPVQLKEFLKFCSSLHFNSVLSDPHKYMDVFTLAATRRNMH